MVLVVQLLLTDFGSCMCLCVTWEAKQNQTWQIGADIFPDPHIDVAKGWLVQGNALQSTAYATCKLAMLEPQQFLVSKATISMQPGIKQ